MKIHRFIGNFDLSKKELEIKDKEIVNQIKNVLRLKVGEAIELCDGKSISTIVDIVEIKKDKVLVKITSLLHKDYEGQHSTKKVHLFCAVLKKENFELVVQKTTECGVSKIVPIISERTIKTGLNIERLRKIAKEASEQSGRINIPEILEPISYKESLELSEKNNTNILFDGSGELFYKMPWEARRSRTEKIPSKEFSCILEDNSPRTYNIFIGPEGGWTEREIAEAKNLNFKIASLGPLTLRGETAAIIATYLISNLK
ncbi:MAG: RsmE family RNA methyltransferase [bacterium]